MRDERVTHVRAAARHNLEDTGGQTGSGGKLAQHECGERGERGRLEHDTVPGGECGSDFPTRNRKWEIPGNDRRDDAERLAEREIESAARNGNRVTEKLRH